MKLNLEKAYVDFKKYFDEDVSYMLEFSYVLGQKFQTDIMCKLNDFILTTDDGIKTYSLFVLFLYEQYAKNNGGDYINFINNNIEDIFEEFKNYYFE